MKRILFLLAVLMMVSGIHPEPVSVYSYACQQPSSPGTANLRQPVYHPYHDVSTAELLGRKNAESIFACSTGSKTRSLWRITDPGLAIYVTIPLTFPSLSSSDLRRRNSQPHIRSWIIRYIHDQDGEKEGALPLI